MLLPVAATIWVFYFVVTALDGLLGVSIPGLGLLATVSLVTAVGFFVSNVIGRRVYAWFDQLMAKLPVGKLLYTSVRDLIQALVGEERRFGRPVAVRLAPDSEVRLLGFVSRKELPAFSLPHHVAVYIPQAYNIAGQVLLVPEAQVEPLGVPPSELLAFVVSGGASGLLPPRTEPPPQAA